MIGLFAALAACADPRDGTYLFTLRLVEDTCDAANPDVGVETEQFGEVWRTDGSVAVDLGLATLQSGRGPVLLAGKDHGREEFRARMETSTAWTSSACEQDEVSRAVEMTGTFGPDGGIEGWLSDSTRRQWACGEEDEGDETCAWNYGVTALRLEAGDAHHEDVAWGYLPGRTGRDGTAR